MKHLNRKGLSFVEAVVSTLVLTLIMAAFFGLHIFARDTLALAHHKIIAMYWAQAQIDARRADIFGHVPAAAFIDPSDTTCLGVTNPIGKGGTRVGANVVNFSGDPVLQQVAVQIVWTE